MRAKVAKTYGWTHDEIRRLPISVFMQYYLSIGPVEAQDALKQIEIVSFPQTKKDVRRKIVRNLKNTINSTIKSSNAGVKSMGDVYKQLASKLSGKRKT